MLCGVRGSPPTAFSPALSSAGSASVCLSAFAPAVSPPWGISHHPRLSKPGSSSCHSLTQRQKYVIHSSCENGQKHPPLFLVVYVGGHVSISFQEMYGTFNTFRGKVSPTGMLSRQGETHILLRFTAHLLQKMRAVHFFFLNTSSSFFFPWKSLRGSSESHWASDLSVQCPQGPSSGLGSAPSIQPF